MQATHAKILNISKDCFSALADGMKEYEYSPKRREGFILHEAAANRIQGKYMYPDAQKVRGIDPETLEVTEELIPRMQTCTFELILSTNLARVTERRKDLAALEDVFNGMEGVRCEMEDFATDVVEIFRTLRQQWGTLDLRNMRIKDYLGREGLLTTANFKLMEPGNMDAIFDKYKGSVTGFAASIKTDMGKQQISVAKNGSIRASEDIPPDMLQTTLNLLSQFHETVEVEMVEV